jgi:hypothetical protein
MKKYLGNAFSLQMLDISQPSMVKITPLGKEDFKKELKGGFISAVGHADTAAVLADELDLQVEANRIFVSLEKGDVLLVAQLTGGRLPEGTTTLPDGFSFSYLKVELV